ncbi:MAG TPA: YraN family protein [Candidatus Paceibacterota bacterium]
MKNIETGKIGENIAYKYLLNNMYLILARNHKERFDEIDIIARHRDGTLVFCEVKTLTAQRGSSLGGFMPEDNLSQMKRRKMIRAAQAFLIRNPGMAWENRGWQIDLIAIVLRNGTFGDLRHYENI